jgi:hypothetical protein
MDERAVHTIPVWAVEEKCRKCGEPAAHKVEEVSGPSNFHPLTAYLCCGCFEGIAGSLHSRYPYELNEALPST